MKGEVEACFPLWRKSDLWARGPVGVRLFLTPCEGPVSWERAVLMEGVGSLWSCRDGSVFP